MKKILVTGAGGFIGHHLIKYLKEKRYWVRGVDIKPPLFEKTSADNYQMLDLRNFENCIKAVKGIEEVYQLAADMGGIGYITEHVADVFRNNALINLHMLEAAKTNNIQKYLFTSSACIYPQYLQKKSSVKALKEKDAYPADAEPGYGWEKLFGELGCKYYMKSYKFKVYIVRFHNIFGPLGTYEGGREKAPAALCRKIALAKNGSIVEIWGDGKQTRSYCYISDCVRGIHNLMGSDYHKPINLGQDRLISVDGLVDMVAAIAGKSIKKRYSLSSPQGVRGRNADISLIKKVLKWEPKISLEKGLEKTYRWIEGRLNQK